MTAAVRKPFVLASLALAVAVFVALGASSASGQGEGLPGQGFLPDGRAWEMVSPPDKNGSNVIAATARIRAAADGDGIVFSSLGAFGDALGAGVGNEYMARRLGEPDGSGWSTHALTPRLDSIPFDTVVSAGFEPRYVGEMSDDLTAGVFMSHTALTGEDPAIEQVLNLYRRTDLTTPGAGSYQLASPCPLCAGLPLPEPATSLEVLNATPWFAGVDPEFEHVVFESQQRLTADAPTGSELARLYELAGDSLRYVGRTPVAPATACDDANGPACTGGAGGEASIAGQGAGASHSPVLTPHVVSDGSDGHSRVFFTRPTANNGSPSPSAFVGRLYMRVDGTSTVQLNATERTAPTSFQAARYFDASADGTRAFFTTNQALTDDSPTSSTKLYMYDADTVHDEVQRVTVSATAGTFNLTFAGQTTADLPYNATADQVDGALSAATGAADNTLVVSGGPGDATGAAPYEVTFRGPYAGIDQPLMTAANGATPLSGGTGVTVTPRVRGGGHLTYLSVDTELADGTNSVPGMIGASEAGDYVYFLVNGQLVAGKPIFGARIYLWHNGQITHIGRAPGGTAQLQLLTSGAGGIRQPKVSPSGRHLLFATTAGQELLSRDGGLDYDHGSTCEGGLDGTGGCREVYVYSADRDELLCASCRPSGAPATAHAATYARAYIGGSKMTWTEGNALSDDGRYVFFTSGESLVPEDVNGPCKVTPEMGEGACADAYVFDTLDEEVSLLSSGRSESGSYFLDASDDGRDAFIATNEQLSEWDGDGNYDLYDARIGGGFPEPDPAPAGCSGDGCQDPASNASPGSRLDSSKLNGPGDPPIAARPDLERCQALASNARKARRRARSLRKRAGKTSGRRARQLRRRARRATRTAQRASGAAARCRAQAARASSGPGGGR